MLRHVEFYHGEIGVETAGDFRVDIKWYFLVRESMDIYLAVFLSIYLSVFLCSLLHHYTFPAFYPHSSASFSTSINLFYPSSASVHLFSFPHLIHQHPFPYPSSRSIIPQHPSPYPASLFFIPQHPFFSFIKVPPLISIPFYHSPASVSSFSLLNSALTVSCTFIYGTLLNLF